MVKLGYRIGIVRNGGQIEWKVSNPPVPEIFNPTVFPGMPEQPTFRQVMEYLTGMGKD